MPGLEAGVSEQRGGQRQRTTEASFPSFPCQSRHRLRSPSLIAGFLLGPAFLLLNLTISLVLGSDIFPFLTCQTVPVEPPLLLLLQNPPGLGKGA